MYIYTVASQKGGVGKTSTVATLAHLAAVVGRRVLCIDTDPQGSLSYILGAQTASGGSYELLRGHTVKPQPAGKGWGVSIIPASLNLAQIDIELATNKDRNKLLRSALEPLREDFDVAFIDTPPTLGTTLLAALVATDEVIIPVQADTFAAQSLYQLQATINQVRQVYNPGLKVAGVLFTRYSSRTILSRNMLAQAQNTAERMGWPYFTTQIREGVAIKEAQALRVPLPSYSPKCHQTDDYSHILVDILGGKDNG